MRIPNAVDVQDVKNRQLLGVLQKEGGEQLQKRCGELVDSLSAEKMSVF